MPRPIDAAALVAEARAILADPGLRSIHPLTYALVGALAWNASRGYGERDRLLPQAGRLNDAQIRLIREALTLPLKRLTSDGNAGELYSRASADIEYFQRNLGHSGWLLSRPIPDDWPTTRALAAAARRDPVFGWLLVPRSPYEVATWASVGRPADRPLRRYLRRHGRVQAWLPVRLAFADRYDPALWRRIEVEVRRARKCPRDRPLAWLPPLFYHQVRTALMYGDRSSRRRSYARALSLIERWPWRNSLHFRQTIGDAVNYLVAAGRLDEARRLLGQADRTDSDTRFSLPRLLLARSESELALQMGRTDASVAMPMLNRLSIDSLGRLAARPEVPARYRAIFARIAWTRLYARGRPVPRRLDRLMRRLNPEITAGWNSPPGSGPEDPRLLLDVLRSPGLNILMGRFAFVSNYGQDPGLTRIDTFQHSDNNWWCAWQRQRHAGHAAEFLHRQFFAGPPWRDERKAEVARAERRLRPLLRQSWLWRARQSEAEQAALAGIDSAPRLLAERAVRWGGSSGGGQDEALALAVRATRYGCQRQGRHGAYSRAAFALLHRRYPGSAAAKRTPYWFD